MEAPNTSRGGSRAGAAEVDHVQKTKAAPCEARATTVLSDKYGRSRARMASTYAVWVGHPTSPG